MMFGFDTDTKDVFDKTLTTIKKLQIDVADFCILTPFPGTPLFKKLEEERRIITKNWTYYNMKNVVFQPKHMAPDELLQGVRKLYNDFYSTPYTMKRVIQSMRLGLYPFSLVLARNLIANMNRKLLYP
jgi:radical SAM superfamily enzyme YgiQ (UPF0313 family)